MIKKAKITYPLRTWKWIWEQTNRIRKCDILALSGLILIMHGILEIASTWSGWFIVIVGLVFLARSHELDPNR